MKRKTSDTLRALALLVLFVSGAILGLSLIWWQFGAWKDAHFAFGWQAPPDAFYSSYVVFVGFFIFAGCALCVSGLLRYDLRSKRKGRK